MDAFACIPKEYAYNCGPFRTREDIDAALDDDSLWLRFDIKDEVLIYELRKIPNSKVYQLKQSKYLFEFDKATPDRQLDITHWQPLKSVLNLRQSSQTNKDIELKQHSIKLVRAKVELEANCLRCKLDDLLNYCNGALEIRLSPLIFAVNKKREVIVLGNPLPSIRGTLYHEKDGLIIPLAYQTYPPLSPAIIKKIYDVKPGDYLCLDQQGHELIRKFCFERLSRRSIRLIHQQMDVLLG